VTALHSVSFTELYLAQAKRIMSEAEQDTVTDMIAQNPMGGVIVKGTGGLRKIRIPLAGRGKRGGGRVIYWYHSIDNPIVLLMVFAKNVADDMTASQRKLLMAEADALLANFGGRQ
jgi:RelE toxin of RelE / RelB toxin-antitoxin system